jgi:hypothetical protein
MSPAGILYGVFGMQLFTIDPATGKTALIANITGAVGVEAIAFGPDGILYAVGSPSDPTSSTTLYTLNMATGVLSLVGPILVGGTPVTDIDTLAFGTDGFLYGADSVSGVQAALIRINPNDPTNATVLGNTKVTGLNGLTEDTQPLRIVTIDIKPGSFPNSINPRSQGVIPVAILTTDTFDATTVDPLSVKFGPAGATESHGRGHIEDVDGDSDLDLVLHFRTQDPGIQCGDTSASLTGNTFDGAAIHGSDSIRTVGCK